ncbi:MAG: hypothetical protein QE484_12145 [Rhizobium sp.]|nr:hypothetical protein [Rhizobium sp.]
MKRTIALLAATTLALQAGLQPAQAGMSDKDKAAAAAAAIAILGIAALAHNKHHYQGGYEPGGGEETAEFERGYRDGVHGYPYWEGNRTPSYAEGYQAGDRERENAMAHRRVAADAKAPPMAYQGCAEIVARNFAVGMNHVHFTRARSPAKHEWQIEAAVGHQYMTCTMRDTGQLIDLRGGQL